MAHIDFKVTSWFRIKFDEEYITELIREIKNNKLKSSYDIYNFLHKKDSSISWESIDGTQEDMEVDENANYPTIEVFNDEDELRLFNGHKDDMDDIVDGYYTASNSGGYEILIHEAGDAVKVIDAYGSSWTEISDWLEIEYVRNEETGEDEAWIDPDIAEECGHYNIPFNHVMKK
ncbi:hypothetical protein KY334_04310 [Candidatus Woesearchaeota archaeon]|nr:hypothetical protein [Candidatus Woesearchaeota archaeon]